MNIALQNSALASDGGNRTTHEAARAQLQAAEKDGTLRAVHTRNGSVWHLR
ncbi:MAG: hypothetical protein R2817_14175 [Flavobacteriales bacterium]